MRRIPQLIAVLALGLALASCGDTSGKSAPTPRKIPHAKSGSKTGGKNRSGKRSILPDDLKTSEEVSNSGQKPGPPEAKPGQPAKKTGPDKKKQPENPDGGDQGGGEESGGDEGFVESPGDDGGGDQGGGDDGADQGGDEGGGDGGGEEEGGSEEEGE